MEPKALTTREVEQEVHMQDLSDRYNSFEILNHFLYFSLLIYTPQVICVKSKKRICSYISKICNFMLWIIIFILVMFSQLLNSPWDVCFEPVNEKVYIAMAGQHHIWEHSTLDGTTKAFSGDGYERNANGSR